MRNLESFIENSFAIIAAIVFIYILSIVRFNENLKNINYEIRYRAGIFFSKNISFLGWISIAISIGVSSMFIVSVNTQNQDNLALLAMFGPFLLPGVFAAFLVGMIFVVAGQAACAIFDNSNCTRAMLEIMQNNLNTKDDDSGFS